VAAPGSLKWCHSRREQQLDGYPFSTIQSPPEVSLFSPGSLR
jgi:hypothetical protein